MFRDVRRRVDLVEQTHVTTACPVVEQHCLLASMLGKIPSIEPLHVEPTAVMISIKREIVISFMCDEGNPWVGLCHVLENG